MARSLVKIYSRRGILSKPLRCFHLRTDVGQTSRRCLDARNPIYLSVRVPREQPMWMKQRFVSSDRRSFRRGIQHGGEHEQMNEFSHHRCCELFCLQGLVSAQQWDRISFLIFEKSQRHLIWGNSSAIVSPFDPSSDRGLTLVENPFYTSTVILSELTKVAHAYCILNRSLKN